MNNQGRKRSKEEMFQVIQEWLNWVANLSGISNYF